MDRLPLQVATDRDDVRPMLDQRLRQDPVGATVLGTVRLALDRADAQVWCAATLDGSAVAVRSSPRYPVTLAGDWTVDLQPELAALLAALPDLAGLSGRADVVAAVASSLPAPASRRASRLYRLEALSEPCGIDGHARRAVLADRPLVRDWYAAFAAEAAGIGGDVDQRVEEALTSGGCWLWSKASGEAVSLATRRPSIAGSARIGPVYTPAVRRGRGYGSAVTAAATRDVLDEGAVPVLFADLSNPIANKIYQRLGYHPVRDDLKLFFA